jgi:alkylation response protein AidB-like acyl-CoA dehydrogenase
MDIAANSIKSVVTDYMHEASQSLMQLVGAKGYRLDHIAGVLWLTAVRFRFLKVLMIFSTSRSLSQC